MNGKVKMRTPEQIKLEIAKLKQEITDYSKMGCCTSEYNKKLNDLQKELKEVEKNGRD